MNKLKYLLYGIFLSVSVRLSAQKNDYVWLSGYDSQVGYYNGVRFGASILNFNYDPMQVSYDSIGMNFDYTNTSFCDSDGNLLFYTNGIYIANSLDEKIENSDSLNAGWLQYVLDTSMQRYGYRNPQGVICIRSLNNPYQYYLLYSFLDSSINGISCKKILIALLDMSLNNGHGTVVYKNQPIITSLLGGEISATRHGNGRDWWILEQKRNSSCYYRILISDTGVSVLDDLTCQSGWIPDGYVGASCFSPDGSKYVYLSGYTGLNVFDFDRCTGELSNARNLQMPVIIQKEWIGLGVAISPNNRFLYACATNEVYQFDLEAENIFADIDTVARFDSIDWLARFEIMQAGPDGKIYISCGNTDTVLHVINYPDLKGDSCGFVQRGIGLPSYTNSIPNFPNYRLGKLTGSVCDTVWTDVDEVKIANREKILKVFPNPATDIVTLDYGFTDWSKTGEVSLEIVNELGQKTFTEKLPQYSGYQKLDVSKYASGIYTAYIKRDEQVIAVQKFAKE